MGSSKKRTILFRNTFKYLWSSWQEAPKAELRPYFIGVSLPNPCMVLSLDRGTQCRPLNTVVLIIGPPKMVPLVLGNPHITRLSKAPATAGIVESWVSC